MTKRELSRYGSGRSHLRLVANAATVRQATKCLDKSGRRVCCQSFDCGLQLGGGLLGDLLQGWLSGQVD
jgi:hypothetical protein